MTTELEKQHAILNFTDSLECMNSIRDEMYKCILHLERDSNTSKLKEINIKLRRLAGWEKL